MKIHRLFFAVSALCFALAAHEVIASGGSGGGGLNRTLDRIATLISGEDASSNTTSVTNGVIRGGTHVAGGTADQSGTVTIESPDSKGSGESAIIFKAPVPAGSGTGVNATTEIMRIAYVDALASKGVEITGVLDATGVVRAGGNIVTTGGSLYPRGPNAGAPIMVMDQGASGNHRILGLDNLAEMMCLGEGGAIAGSTCYVSLVSTNSAEAVVFGKPFWGTLSTVAATGTNQATAAAIPAGAVWVNVTGCTASTAVTLPTGSVATCVRIGAANAAGGSSCRVFGHNSDDDTINGGAADAVYAQTAGASLTYCTANGVAWSTY